jgi:hypothetical protein
MKQKKTALVKELKDMKVDDQVVTDILASLSSIRYVVGGLNYFLN